MKKSEKLWIGIGILLVVNVIFYYVKPGGDKILLVVSDLIPIACSFIASISLLYAVRAFREFDFPKFAWLMIFIGIFLDFLAESTYGILEIFNLYDVKNEDYSIADYIWCSGYVTIIIGLVTMYIGYKKSGFPIGNYKLYGILAPLILVLFSIVIYNLLIPIIKDQETETLAKFFYLFYPIGDLFTVVPALILMYITSLFGKGIISKPWKYLAFGFICFTLADLIYSYLSWQEKYDIGNPIDIAWNMGYLLIGLSGLYQWELIDSINGGSK
jgi:hypothetical protein